MRKKLEDSVAAYNMIKCSREYARKLRIKALFVPVEIDGVTLRARTNLYYNPSTGKCGIGAHGINFKNVGIYPTTHQKLKCINKHGIDMLKKQREYKSYR